MPGMGESSAEKVRLGSLVEPTFRKENGGTPITVENSLPAAFGSLGSS